MDISTIYSQYDMGDMEKQISQLFPDWNLHLYDLFSSIIEGRGMESIKTIVYTLLDSFANELAGMKSVFITIILIGIISAVFVSLTDIFDNHQVADCAFYLAYLILIIFIVQIYSQVFSITQSTLENIVSFMKVMLPTYFLTVTAAGGSFSALGFYQVFMITLYGVELLLSGVIVPVIGFYMILSVINGIWEEEKLDMLINILKKTVKGILKFLIAIVSGTGILQSMITPVIDSAKMAVLQKSVSAIPGLGDLAGGATQVLLGSAVLIKNATGILILLLLLFLCAFPLCKLFGIMAIMKGAAAIMGIAADKRMTNCTNRVGDGVMLLFQTMLTSITFFFILVTIIAFTTNRGF